MALYSSAAFLYQECLPLQNIMTLCKIANHAVRKKSVGLLKLDYFSGGIEYESDTLARVYLKNARLTFENVVAQNYQYYLKNHLMSTQVVFEDDGNGVARAISQHQQYPFGLEMEGNFTVDNSIKQLYNFKEVVQDFGLGWSDFGFRYYSRADVPVFMGVDLISDKFPWVSAGTPRPQIQAVA